MLFVGSAAHAFICMSQSSLSMVSLACHHVGSGCDEQVAQSMIFTWFCCRELCGLKAIMVMIRDRTLMNLRLP